MGCASSAPLAEKGKNLVEGVKDAANETISKSERALQDTTDTIKDGIASGIDTVKDTVQTALNNAEESVGNVGRHLRNSFDFTSSKTSENLAQESNFSAAEAVSQAETVIVSETEQAKEAFQSGTSPFFETVHSLEEEMETKLNGLGATALNHLQERAENAMKNGTEVLEDLENDSKDLLGETIDEAKEKVEELHEEMEKVVLEGGNRSPDKEEQPPTFWEAAADAILMNKTIKNMESARERILFYPAVCEKPDLDRREQQIHDIVLENAERPL